jgi:Tol biopolymer transport system component
MAVLGAVSLVSVTIVGTRAALDGPAGPQSAGPISGSLAGAATGASLPGFDVPAVDYTLDLDTDLMTPLPEAIIDSLGPTYVGTSTYEGELSRYALSPDGSRLAFIGDDPVNKTQQLFVAGIDGSGIRQLTTAHITTIGPIGAATPAWSPDGRAIVFDSPQGIYVVDVSSGTLTRVVAPEVNSGYEAYKDPTFSPDGTRIIYSTDHQIRVVSVAGGQSTVLFGGGTGGIGDANNASISPDGNQVTMVGGPFQGGCCTRLIMNIDGTDMRILTQQYEIWSSNASGTWSPNGDRIVAEGGIDGIAVIDVATGKVEIVARGNGALWLDDHTLLVEVS